MICCLRRDEAQLPQLPKGRLIGRIPLTKVTAVDQRIFGQTAVFHVGQDAGDAGTKEAGLFAVTVGVFRFIHGVCVLNSGLCVEFLELKRKHENVVDLVGVFGSFVVAVVGAGSQQHVGVDAVEHPAARHGSIGVG